MWYAESGHFQYLHIPRNVDDVLLLIACPSYSFNPYLCFYQELMTTQEKYSNAEVQSQMLRQERDLLKNVEARLSQERDSLLRDQRAQNLLLANLEAIQVIINLNFLLTSH